MLTLKTYVESLAYSPDSKNYLAKIPENCEEMFFETSYGRLHTLHLKPDSLPKATIIHFHGSGFNVKKHFGHVSWMAKKDYRVVMFDYPGYGKSDGHANRTSVVRASREIIQKITNLYPDSPIIVFGQSLGGAIALELQDTWKNCDQVYALVIDSTFGSYARMASIKLRKKKGLVSLSQKFLPFFLDNKHDPKKMIEKITKPILLLHSKGDTIVPFQEANDLVHNAKIDLEFWIQYTPDHTGVFRPNYRKFREKLDNWILETIEKGKS